MQIRFAQFQEVTGGRQPPSASSTIAAAIRTVSSSFRRPTICTPIGNPSDVTATGTQTQTGTLSVNCSVVNQSGTAVEMVCSFLRRGTAERSSQVLTANFNGDVEFAFPNVDRNNTYSIVLSLNTSDSTIKVSGTFTVMMTDQR